MWRIPRRVVQAILHQGPHIKVLASVDCVPILWRQTACLDVLFDLLEQTRRLVAVVGEMAHVRSILRTRGTEAGEFVKRLLEAMIAGEYSLGRSLGV